MKHSLAEIGTKIDVEAPELRSLELMLADSADNAAPAPEAHAQGTPRTFMPTVPASQYADLKTQLEDATTADKPVQAEADAQAEEQALASIVLIGPNLAGATNVDGLTPPDNHGAVGLDHFVEVTNSHIDIFLRSTNARTSIPLKSFFGYSTRVLYGARAVYDSVWNRWIVTAVAFQESSAVQLQFIAVSTTSNALGPFYIYRINVTFNTGDLWDYSQLGMDQDAIILTANVFMASGAYRGTDMFAVAKARLYNGLGFSVPVFTGLRGTLAPPIVLDQNGRTYLIAASGGSTLSLYTLTNSSTPNTIALSAPVNITVGAYSAPPDAPQPGTAARLDTLDGRFLSASTQTGDFLWQVHTVSLGSYAAPKFYQINTVTNAVVRSAYFFGTATSFDFNATIAANSANDIFVTWTMTDPPQGTQAQVRFSGFDHNTGATYILGPGVAAFTSASSYAGGRWGNYSAVTLDPRNTRRAWLVNENILAGNWGSRIVGIGF